MAKGKKTPTMATRTYTRKNHGPKRHLHSAIYPKTLRTQMQRQGALSKYFDFDSFCLALQARNVKADYKLMWSCYTSTKLQDSNGNFSYRAADQFFDDAAAIGKDVMAQQKKAK